MPEDKIIYVYTVRSWLTPHFKEDFKKQVFIVSVVIGW